VISDQQIRPALERFIEHDFVQIDAQKCALDGSCGCAERLQQEPGVVPLFAQIERCQVLEQRDHFGQRSAHARQHSAERLRRGPRI
jgi:hypothetical protein